MLAVNHLAPYLLTYELLDHLCDAPNPRVVVTASELDAYARSKLANIAFTVELDDRFPDDSTAMINCVHSGFVPSTERFPEASLQTRLLVRIAGLVPGVTTSKQVVAERLQTFLVNPRCGSVSGQYIGSDGLVDPASEVTDQAVRRRLWRMSAELVGITPDWPAPSTN